VLLLLLLLTLPSEGFEVHPSAHTAVLHRSLLLLLLLLQWHHESCSEDALLNLHWLCSLNSSSSSSCRCFWPSRPLLLLDRLPLLLPLVC
jgi:hypothetical protein